MLLDKNPPSLFNLANLYIYINNNTRMKVLSVKVSSKIHFVSCECIKGWTFQIVCLIECLGKILNKLTSTRQVLKTTTWRKLKLYTHVYQGLGKLF